MRKKYVYAVYRGDEFIDVGTIKELAQNLNKKETTLKFYATPSNFKRIKNMNKHLIVVKVGKEDDDY